jgi:hypothetical protein
MSGSVNSRARGPHKLLTPPKILAGTAGTGAFLLVALLVGYSTGWFVQAQSCPSCNMPVPQGGVCVTICSAGGEGGLTLVGTILLMLAVAFLALALVIYLVPFRRWRAMAIA